LLNTCYKDKHISTSLSWKMMNKELVNITMTVFNCGMDSPWNHIFNVQALSSVWTLPVSWYPLWWVEWHSRDGQLSKRMGSSRVCPVCFLL